jgi:hypothetical protein
MRLRCVVKAFRELSRLDGGEKNPKSNNKKKKITGDSLYGRAVFVL